MWQFLTALINNLFSLIVLPFVFLAWIISLPFVACGICLGEKNKPAISNSDIDKISIKLNEFNKNHEENNNISKSEIKRMNEEIKKDVKKIEHEMKSQMTKSEYKSVKKELKQEFKELLKSSSTLSIFGKKKPGTLQETAPVSAQEICMSNR